MIEKLKRQLARNWANCDQRFKKMAERGPDYMLTLAARQAMKALLGEEELDHYLAMADIADSPLEAANSVHAPWHLGWFGSSSRARPSGKL